MEQTRECNAKFTTESWSMTTSNHMAAEILKL